MTLTQAGRRLTLSHKAAFGEHAYDIIFFAVMVVVLAGSFVVFLISIAKANISLEHFPLDVGRYPYPVCRK